LACGGIGQAVFLVTMQAAYVRGDTRTPLLSMVLQTVVCLGLCGVAVAASGTRVVVLVGLAYAAASLFGGTHLYVRVRRTMSTPDEHVWPTLLRVGTGTLVMVGPVLLSTAVLTATVPGRLGWTLALAVGSITGLVVFGLSQWLMRAPELGWLLGGFHAKRLPGIALAEPRP
jgi:peptidoglycan biosynthesis protein MviN/MurJ (putative lipid II flippase)